MNRFLVIMLTGASMLAHGNDAVIGCYAVHVVSPSDKIDMKSVRLTDQAVTFPWSTRGSMRVVPATSTDTFGYSAAYWVRKDDAVVITFTNNGLAGIEIHARPTKVGLQGTMEHFWDAEPFSTDAHEVVLARTACASFH
jgi:hypothetical protein